MEKKKTIIENEVEEIFDLEDGELEQSLMDYYEEGWEKEDNYPYKVDKETFQTRFGSIYPGRRLLCVQLDGFSHRVYMDDGPGTPMYIERVNCAPEQRGNGTNTVKAKKFFEGYFNYMY